MARNKKKGFSLGAKQIIACAVSLAILAAGVCCTGYASRGADGNWFGNRDLSTWHWTDKAPEGVGEDNKDPADTNKYVDGMVTSVTSANKMRLASRPMTAAAMAKTDSQYMLSATIEPADADEQTLIWSVAFKNPASEWASGKTVTDYVTVTPTSDTKNARVSCLNAFGEQILVTATSSDNPEAKATCTCDYVMRAKNLVFEFGEGGFDNISYTYSVEGTAHTIASELQINSMTMRLTNNTSITGLGKGDFSNEIDKKLQPLFIAEWGEYEGINRLNTTRTREVTLVINQESKTVSVPNGKGSAFMYVENYSDEDWSVDWTDEERAKAGEFIDQAFRQAAKDYTKGYHAMVTVNYQMTYNGENYGSGEIKTYFSFNYQTIKVGVGSVNWTSPDMSGIVF